MSRTCAIMQPTYLPWAGYFDLMDQADVFLFLDNVQMQKSSWQTRNRIKTHQGELYLSLDRYKSADGVLPTLAQARLNEQQQWRKKHLKSIENAYSRAPYFEPVFALLSEGLAFSAPQTLADLNIGLITALARAMGINTVLERSSQLQPVSSDRIERLANLCLLQQCQRYLSPRGAWDYFEALQGETVFQAHHIALAYQHYIPPVYPQLHGAFMPGLSVVDLLFNCGFEQALAVIRKGRRPAWSHQALVEVSENV